MKGVTSEGNLSGYYIDRNRLSINEEVDKLNKKIKSIKTSLKAQEKHNEDLHLKIKNQKENHQMEIIQLENEYKKYKELYEMLLDKYEAKSLELKEYKKKLKRMEIEQYRIKATDSDEELQKDYKDALLKQEKELIRIKEENKLLYEQVFEKNGKLKELEVFVSKNYLNSHKVEQKDKSFLANIKSAIESKNDEFERLMHEKSKVLTSKYELEKDINELTLKYTKTHTELEFERKLSKQAKEKSEKYEKDIAKLAEQNKAINVKYQEILNFSYDIQKDMEREIQSITKEVLRKDHK